MGNTHPVSLILKPKKSSKSSALLIKANNPSTTRRKEKGARGSPCLKLFLI